MIPHEASDQILKMKLNKCGFNAHETEGAVKQMQYLFNLDDIKIDFTKEAKISIAKKAKELGTNARGLKNIMDTILLPFQFDSVEMKIKGVEAIKITDAVVDKSADPVLVFRKTNATSKKQN